MIELRILRLIAPHLPRVALATLVSAGAELAGIALIATAAWLLASASFQPPLTALTVAIVAVRTFAIARGVLRYLDRLIGHDAVLRALADLRAVVFRAAEPLAPMGSRMFSGGDLLSRLVGDVDSVQDLVLRVIAPVWTALVVCVATVSFTAVFSGPAALVLLVGLAVGAIGLPLIAFRRATTTAAALAPHRAALSQSTVDLARGARDLAAYGATDTARERTRRDATALADAERATANTTAVTGALGAVVAGATVLGVLWTTSHLGVMSAVLTLTCLVGFETVTALPAVTTRLAESRSATRRLVALLDEPPIVPDPAEPAPTPRDTTVRLRNARPALPGRPVPAGDGARPVPGVNLDLPPGHRVAIVGPSGAGKTMLLSMLLRFVPVGGGEITLGGTDITRLSGDDVRSVIGGMTSPAHLFTMSLRDNLLLAAPDASDTRIAEALTAAGLADWTDRLDVVPGEDGDRLSGGQRQRFLLARALLADRPVLVLDEPTEHLDDETADAVTADLLRATVGRSLILVTHRLAGLDALDEILVVEDGRVVRRGDHDHLVSCDGYYADAWAMTGTNPAPGTTTSP